MATPTAKDLGITFSQGAQATPQGIANAQATGMYSNTPGYSTPAPVTTPTSSPSLPPAMAESIARASGGTTLPNPTGVTPEQFANPIPSANSNPTDNAKVAANLNTAFQQVKDTPTPQTQGQAAPIIQQATTAASQIPTFYKPDPNSQTVYNAKGEALSHDQYLAQGGKADYSNVTNGQIPASQGTPLNGVEQQLALDPTYQKLLKDQTEASNAENQKKSLTDYYDKMAKDAGLDTINTDLMNTKKIIDGTQDDIRNEVQAANGFATDSQVLALADARNKTLIKHYNDLVTQQSNIENHINTMVNLAGQDRSYAIQVAKDKLQIDQQIADYKDKFISNAKEQYNNVIKTVGYAGLYASIAHDPNSIGLVERTLGMNPGELAKLAANDNTLEMNKLDVQAKKASINASNASAASSAASAAKARSDLAFESTHGGMTAADVAKQGQSLLDDASKYVADLDARKVTWGAAWNALHTKYPDATTQTLDGILNASLYRNSDHGG